MGGWVFFLIPIAAIVGGCTIAIVGITSRARVREAQIRERIAMIERGLMPSPEGDPAAFDRALLTPAQGVVRRDPARWRRAGIVVTGLGLGMLVMFGMIGETDGMAIGGFVAVLGIAFFVSSFVTGSEPPAFPYSGPLPARPTQPASNPSSDSR
jgi:hypothetical protein